MTDAHRSHASAGSQHLNDSAALREATVAASRMVKYGASLLAAALLLLALAVYLCIPGVSQAASLASDSATVPGPALASAAAFCRDAASNVAALASSVRADVDDKLEDMLSAGQWPRFDLAGKYDQIARQVHDGLDWMAHAAG